MGSLRNPVGPLPSSIYWRRRAVLASVAALLAMLAVWTVSSGAGKSSTNGKGQGGSGPVTQITPGPSGSGPAISQAPGGRGESGSGGSGASAGSGTGSDPGTSPGAGKNGEPGAEPGGADQGGAGGSGGSSAGQVVPADSPVPTCAPGALDWEVKSVKNQYEPGEKPRLELVTHNISGTTCKVDLGPKQAVLTITQASNPKAVWSSADCPAGAPSVFYRVPSQGETKQDLEWDRHFSEATQCQSPPAGVAAADTYVVEVRSPGIQGVARTSFVLKPE
ncbi:hypothetical protein [Streptomyces sp. NBC_01264]|uniref:hypothetical protein n=1 Tax=Streptomyces sp. NBC_01264 TaxID=2903804 RepID=UPI00224D6B06|nr:hypothetical protein [Streptomyces sp. NBC_01264]MCX4780209.1 hypothetical protein [Streptomyces sp. NBC_01264]